MPTQRTGNSQGRRSGDMPREFLQVLGRGSKKELVLCRARAAKPQAPKPEDPLEMGKNHLDFLALTPGLLELRCANQRAGKVAGIVVDVTRYSA